jgi:hypothetical protein
MRTTHQLQRSPRYAYRQALIFREVYIPYYRKVITASLAMLSRGELYHGLFPFREIYTRYNGGRGTVYLSIIFKEKIQNCR